MSLIKVIGIILAMLVVWELFLGDIVRGFLPSA
jgi:hypothetical protein